MWDWRGSRNAAEGCRGKDLVRGQVAPGTRKCWNLSSSQTDNAREARKEVSGGTIDDTGRRQPFETGKEQKEARRWFLEESGTESMELMDLTGTASKLEA